MSLVPYVIEQTSRGESSLTIFIPDLLKDRIIFLGEEVNDVSASLVVAAAAFPGSRRPWKGYSALYQQPGRFCDSRHGYL